MTASVAFQTLQAQFAAHIRNPDQAPAPAGIEERRLKIYRDLFFNNVESAIASAFPVLRKLTEEARWQRLVRAFYHEHAAHTPLFHQLAKEFLDWYGDAAADLGEPPFGPELAHYEWVELALSLAQGSPPAPLTSADNLLHTPLVKSALAWCLVYAFDVQRIAPDYQPQHAPANPTWIVVYRDAEDSVRFLAINHVSARLIALLEEHPSSTGEQLLLLVAAELQHPQPMAVVEQGRALVAMLAERQIIGSVL
jgi:hypothetical protein